MVPLFCVHVSHSSFCAGVRGGMFKWSLARLNKRVCHMLFDSLMKQEIGFFEETEPGEEDGQIKRETRRRERVAEREGNMADRERRNREGQREKETRLKDGKCSVISSG